MKNHNRKFIFSMLGLVFLLSQVMVGHAADSEKKFGRFLYAEYDVPAELISKYAEFKPSAPDKRESALVNALIADSVDWQGPTFRAVAASNPYTIAVTVLGTAREDGDVSTMWQSGWTIEDNMSGPQQRLTPLPGVARTGVKAGEVLKLTGASSPVSFKENKDTSAFLGLVNARNLDIHSVKVQVWTGMANPSGTDLFLAFRWLLVPLVMLGLMWWFRRS